MHKGPTPYRQTPPPQPPMDSLPDNGNAASQPASPAASSAIVLPTSAPNKPALSALNSHIGFEPKKDDFKINKKSATRMGLLALAFLIFYGLLITSKLIADYRSNRQAVPIKQLSDITGLASNFSAEIDDIIVSINNGLDGKTPAQSAVLIASSADVSAVAILDAKGDMIAAHPQNAPILSHLSSLSTPTLDTEAVTLNSVIAPDGQIVPVIVKKTGEHYMAASLADTVLINRQQQTTQKMAIVTRSGQIVDGNHTLGKLGLQKFFNLSAEQFSRLTQPGTDTTERIKINDSQYLLSAKKIPNSDLVLLAAKPDTGISIGTSVIKDDILLFLLLFLGTAALVMTLLNSLKKQSRELQDVQKTTEISQQRYQAATEGKRGGIWEVDLTDDSTFMSASLAGLLGLLRQEQTIPLSDFLELFHPDDREKFLTLIQRDHTQDHAQGESQEEFECDIRVAHLPLLLQCRGRSFTRSGKKMDQVIVGVALDITEQRAAQIRLKTTKARLHNALRSMRNSFAVWDATNHLVVWNDQFEDFFGLTPDSLHIGMDHASVSYLANTAIQGKYHCESAEERWVEYHLKNGRWIRYIETSITETPIAEGGTVSVGTDITELRLREADLKNNEQALNKTATVLQKYQDSIVELAERYEREKIRAEEASQSKSNFLASMSHELRTPLNAINGFSDIMKKEMFGPLGDSRYKEYVNDILFSGQHLLSLINDILDMSKIEAGKMTLNPEVMFLHDMVAQVVRMIRGRADDAGLTLNVDVAKVREIKADPRSVKQILLNLLTNAVKFTPEGGTISVELIQKTSGIIIKVSDTGVGISKENIKKLAKPFEQVNNAANQHSEGTGLGLALSKSLVELHGGNFRIESVVGKGTVVMFSLPNQPASPKEQKPNADVSQEVSKITTDIARILRQKHTAPQTEPITSTPYPYVRPSHQELEEQPLPATDSQAAGDQAASKGSATGKPAA